MSRYIHVRVSPGRDDDLIDWLEALPPGDRSEAVREALRIGIGLAPPLPPPPGSDLAALVRQAVREALAGLEFARSTTTPGDDAEAAFGDKLDRLLGGFK
jgi:hypothetical protein